MAWKSLSVSSIAFCQRQKSDVGGAGRDRTDDLKLAKLPLSQLSYGPVEVHDTCCCSSPRSREVPFRQAATAARQSFAAPSERVSKANLRARQKDWWAWVDLNYRPHAYQACALTN